MREAKLKQLIAAWLDGRIDATDSEALQHQLRTSAEARSTFRMYTKLDAALREHAGSHDESEPLVTAPATTPSRPIAWITPAGLAMAATAVLVVGAIAYQLGKINVDESASTIAAGTSSSGKIASEQNIVDEEVESTIAGYATLRRVAGISWPEGIKPYREGDVLPAGLLEFKDGVAEIDFFCGATLVVEGPAKMELESDWSVRMLRGRLRANVPPAARGFVVKAADSEIVDLGTEFALEVGPEKVRIEVVDGEVKLRGGTHHGRHLVTGQGQSLLGAADEASSLGDLVTIGDVKRRRDSAQLQRFARWKDASRRLASDERLIAYYPIAASKPDRFVSNRSPSGAELDGTLVGSVNHVPGRFGPVSSGLEFDRPGARVRTRIEGEFNSYTFACWVKIDSLEHKYNALFMGDGYENGEPHWQIRDDGRLMFSVMVDDTQEIRVANVVDQRIVVDAGLHRVYFTEPFWDISNSGQWFHIAAVYDPAGRTVKQYVNGRQISSEAIVDKFFIDKLKIGPAEIGNWGQPFRKTPWFAVRNLNGTIDEMIIFDAPLTPQEIETLYEQGKPLGY